MSKSVFFCRALTAAFAVVVVLITCFSFTAKSSLQQRDPSREKIEKEKYAPCNTEVVAGDVLVKFKDRVSEDAIKALMDQALEVFLTRSFNARTFAFEQIGSKQDLYLIHIDGVKVTDLVAFFTQLNAERAKLKAMDDFDIEVQYAQPNYVFYQENVIPNDPRFKQQWALQNSGPGQGGISAVSAWRITTGSDQIVVGVVDTGVTLNHPDLNDNLWEAPQAFNVNVGGNVRCAANTHGFDAGRMNCLPAENNTYHGTRVSGIIGAEGNNNLGIAGVNWTTSIMALRFGTGHQAHIVKAIRFAIEVKKQNNLANLRVLNNSYGYLTSPGVQCQPTPLEEAIQDANRENILFVASAGNDKRNNNDVKPHYPSSFNVPNIIAVAATTGKDNLAKISNYGPTTVHLGAPGTLIVSTDPPNDYEFGGGTSFAAPFVSGAVALILSKCPTLSTAALKACILNNADRVPSLKPYLPEGRRLNVKRALDACRCDQ